MSGNNFFRVRVRVRVRVPIVFPSSAFPIGTRTRTRTRSCHVTQKLYFLNHARILLAMEIPLSQARASIRFSIGYQTTEIEIAEAVQRIIKVVKIFPVHKRL